MEDDDEDQDSNDDESEEDEDRGNLQNNRYEKFTSTQKKQPKVSTWDE